jgi:hypothetical protein
VPGAHWQTPVTLIFRAAIAFSAVSVALTHLTIARRLGADGRDGEAARAEFEHITGARRVSDLLLQATHRATTGRR